MSDYGKLPHGIVVNNPGRLRAAFGCPYKVRRANGIVAFETPHEGIIYLMWRVVELYTTWGQNTPLLFVSHFVQPSETEIAAYIYQLVRRCPWLEGDPREVDIRVDHRSNAIALTKAIVEIENGTPPSGWKFGDLWYPSSFYDLAAHILEFRGFSWAA